MAFAFMAITMSPDEFKQAWELEGDKLVTFPLDTVTTLRICDRDRAFLIYPGLPESAAPFLDFGGKNHADLPSVAK
jgi:molybdopterin-biosynthesis enzyme MoeA-like protein